MVLRDRRIPGTSTNIDQIAIAPSGVWVIDVRNDSGGVRIDDPNSGEARLLLNGRDRTDLVDGLEARIALVRGALSRRSVDVPVRGAICFVDASFQLLRPLTLRGHLIGDSAQTSRSVLADGPISSSELPELTTLLASVLPATFPAISRRAPRAGGEVAAPLPLTPLG